MKTGWFRLSMAGLALISAALGGCSSSSSTTAPSTSGTVASTSPASASPVAPSSPSTPSGQAPQAAEQSGAPPANANGGDGARAAQDIPGINAYFFFPAPGTLTEPDCMHGETRDSSGAAISRWTTTLCAYADPLNAGFTRYYDYNTNDRDHEWVATIGLASDGWIYEQNRWSLADADVWFRYHPSNPNYYEISVTPWGQQYSPFVSLSSYEQAYPTAGSNEEHRMTVALAYMVVMKLQVWHYSGPGATPYTAAQVTTAEQGGGVPPVIQNMNSAEFNKIYATDPVGTIASS